MLLSILLISGFNIILVIKKTSLNNPFILYYAGLFLYGIINPLFNVLIGNLHNEVYRIALLTYQMGLYVFIISYYSNIQFFFNHKVKTHSYKNKNLLILLTCIIGSYIIYFLNSQNLLFNFTKINENGRLGIFENITQLWAISSYIITGIIISVLENSKNLKKDTMFLAPYLVFYYSLLIAIGSRREILITIMPILFYWISSSNHKIKIKHILIGILFLSGFLVTGFIRDLQDSSFSNNSFNLLSANEFYIPYITLIENIKYVQQNDFYYGLSLLNIITIFIPRLILGDLKPNSLAMDFVERIGGTQGYAYSPISELYLNFGLIGVLIGLWMFGKILRNLYNNPLTNRVQLAILFTLSVEFSRSEISSYIYAFTITYLTFLLSKLRLNKQK